MAPKPVGEITAANLTDLVTTIDSGTFISPSGPMSWGTVDICYASEGLEPKVIIKVPVPIMPGQSEAEQRNEALRRARKMLEHACVARGSQPAPVSDLAEMLEELAEELGVRPPTAEPPPRAR